MIWPLQCTATRTNISISELNMLAKDSILSPEIWNVIIITLAALVLNELIIINSSEKKELNVSITIKIIGIIVLLAFSSSSSLKFLILMEATIYPLGFLILSTSKDKDKRESLKFIVVLNTLGSVPFMLYLAIRELNKNYLFSSFFFNHNSIFLIIVLLFLVKTPILIFHLWLTKVHVSASGNCSIILARIIIKLGTIGMMKFSENFLQEKIISFFLSLALICRIYFRLIIIRFFDAKTLIAISSVLHIAIISPLLILKKFSSNLASLIIITSHGLVSYFLFFLITVRYEKRENRRVVFTKSIESIAKILRTIIVIFIFLNLGLPPLINFFSETTFLACLNYIELRIAKIFFARSLLFRIIFTIQINLNVLFIKGETQSEKTETRILLLKFSFYLYWIVIILWFL